MAMYIEKKISQIFSRRDFLKVAGVCVSVVAMSGYLITDIIQKRKAYISLRQKGLYDDDLRLQKSDLVASHDNPVALRAYEELKTVPMGEVAEKLLHTNVYVDRNNLALRSHHV